LVSWYIHRNKKSDSKEKRTVAFYTLRTPRSLHLNLCKFLWGHLKQLLYYSQPINSIEELTGRVVAAGAQIWEDREVFSRVCESMVRAQASITSQGQHFQHLLRIRYAKSNSISGYKVSKWIITESKRIDFEVIY
jgi:hypothetical protein